MASGSVVFRVHSDRPRTNAYISKLRPWRHFIPLKNDLSDFINMTHLIKTRNLRNIAMKAKLLVSNFTYEKEVERVAKELNKLWSIKI